MAVVTIKNIRNDSDLLTIDMDGDRRDRDYIDFEDKMLHDFVRHDNPQTECHTNFDSPDQPRYLDGVFTPSPMTTICIRSDYDFMHDFFKLMHENDWVSDDDYHRVDMICRYH